MDNDTRLKYGLNDVPPWGELLLYGVQWLAITVPTAVIIGKVVAVLHYPDHAAQVLYVQKVFFIMALALFVQLLWGHRLPLIIGPATVLLIGIVASRGSDISAIYTSIVVGGATLFLLGITGLFGYLKQLFTTRVVATILLLIALTMTPTIINFIVTPEIPGAALTNVYFALAFVLLMFLASRFLTGIWKSTLIIWAMLAGSVFYALVLPRYMVTGTGQFSLVASLLHDFNLNLVFEPGLIISFLVCFLALSINDLGSMQSVGELLKLEDMGTRINRGVSFTGLASVAAGFLGVIGLVNFSLSPGVIMSTGSASRFAILPTALGLFALALSPATVAFIGQIPTVIIGSVLIYIMCSQIAAGLLVAYGDQGQFGFDDGLIIGLPLMLGLVISFLPPEVLDSFPTLLRPLLGNGFVVGVLALLLLEHVILQRPDSNNGPA